MSPSWIWSDKITNERGARVGYNHFISCKGEWNNCFRKFSNRVLPPIFISTILQSGKFLNLAHYFPYDVKLPLLAHSRSFLANQKARNATVGAENLLIIIITVCHWKYMKKYIYKRKDSLWTLWVTFRLGKIEIIWFFQAISTAEAEEEFENLKLEELVFNALLIDTSYDRKWRIPILT